MSQVLTAQALHAIYAPAWEAAPGSIPVRNGWSLAWHNACGVFVWQRTIAGIYECSAEQSTADVANTCRVAAEDWLLNNHYYGVIAMMDSEGYRLYDLSYGELYSTIGKGPTIHHALAEAVVEVARSNRR